MLYTIRGAIKKGAGLYYEIVDVMTEEVIKECSTAKEALDFIGAKEAPSVKERLEENFESEVQPVQPVAKPLGITRGAQSK